jgi:uncharacterized protein (TIGR03083 family)
MQQMKNVDEKMLCRIFRGLCGEDEQCHYRKTVMTEVIELISAEASQLQDFLANLGPEAWASPSACAGWVVGDVVAHLTQGARTWSETITRAIAGDFNPPPGQPPLRPGERGSEATAQRAIDFHQSMGKDALLNAFAEGYQHLHQVLRGLQSEDWDKPCFHRRGVLSTRDYVGLRLQELTIHGWDMRSAFDAAATLSERPLPALLGLAQRWLSNTFRPSPSLSAPLRYRFDVSDPAPVQQDVLVSQDRFQIEPVTASRADVTFRCHTGDYILFVYGRLPLDRAMDTGRLVLEGNREQAFLFNTLFQGV